MLVLKLKNIVHLNKKQRSVLTAPKKSKLDLFKKVIDTLLEEAPYSAVKIFEKIKEQGFDGKIGIIKAYVRLKKKEINEKVTVRFETLPGKQAQVDWGHFGSFIDIDGEEKKLYCFFMILGYSRMRYIEFVTDMSTETLIMCHINAFRYFGGYPEEILYDNMKQVVIKRLLKQEDSKLNPLFEDFAGFYGFKPILCRPYRGQTKGKVERTVRYARDNFFIGIKFDNLQDLNEQAFMWCEKINNKIHGTTGEIPYERLKIEKLAKICREYMISRVQIRKVGKDGLLSFQNNKYSVPAEYVGKEVTVSTLDNILKVYYQEKLISLHKISYNKNQMIVNKNHYAKILERSFFKQENTLLNNKIICLPENTVEASNISQLDEIFGRVELG